MKNWVKVNKKDIENLLTKNLDIELSKTSDKNYSEIYLLKVKRISRVSDDNDYMMQEDAINDLIDAKLFSVMSKLSTNVENQNLFESQDLYEDLDFKLEEKMRQLSLSIENKINELKDLNSRELLNDLEIKVNELKNNNNFELERKINASIEEIKQSTKLLDQKIEERILDIKSKINQDLEFKINELKNEFKNVERNFVNINRDIQAQTRTANKGFDHLIKKSTKFESRLDVFGRDMKKVKSIPEIKKEFVVKKIKSKIPKTKTLNVLNPSVTIKQSKPINKHSK